MTTCCRCIIALVLASAFSTYANSQPTGYLIEVRGEVSLHRSAWLQSSQGGVGTDLHLGDTIRLGANAKALILCPDLLTTWQPLPNNVSGVFEGCPRDMESIGSRDGQQVLGVRSSNMSPEVLSPSNSYIRVADPLIRWQPVPNISRYRVSLFERGAPATVIWGPATVEGTSIRYTRKPPLKERVEYFVRVQAVGGLTAQGGPFSLVPSTARQQFDRHQRELSTRVADHLPRQAATTIYLARSGLRAEALEMLTELVTKIDSPALYLLQATCLGQVGAQEAQVDALASARDAAIRQRHLESEADASMKLAQLLPKHVDARNWARRAAEVFRTLGDTRARMAEELLISGRQP